MIERHITIAIVFVVAFVGSGCGEIRHQTLRGGEMVMTTANYRAISQTSIGDSSAPGR